MVAEIGGSTEIIAPRTLDLRSTEVRDNLLTQRECLHASSVPCARMAVKHMVPGVPEKTSRLLFRGAPSPRPGRIPGPSVRPRYHLGLDDATASVVGLLRSPFRGAPTPRGSASLYPR
jgi:hypothetical protein